MSSIGPQMPPQVAKRKRTPHDDDGFDHPSPPTKQCRPQPNTNEIDVDASDSANSNDVGPSLPPKNNEEIGLDSDSDSGTGPQAPSAPKPQPPAARGPVRPPNNDPDTSSDSDDDYGPSLPSASTSKPSIGPSLPPSEPTPQRDTWMLAPPKSSAYAERDPTRIRARKFASKPGPSTDNNSSGVSSIWTETPEEKLKRLQDAVLGRNGGPDDDRGTGTAGSGARSREQEERERRIAANIKAQRGKSLYDEHQNRRDTDGVAKEEEEDDPSKRGFDREKDMALGGKIGTAQRRELMSKSANFGGRFQKGSYL